MRTQVNVPIVKDELFKTKQEMHDRQLLGDQRSEEEINQSQKFKKVISQKAFQFGADSGVTGEFIVHQASLHMMREISEIDEIIKSF